MPLWLFFRALWKRWWALMGSAIFTLLGIWGGWYHETDSWLVKASIVAAVLSFLVASFLAWNEEHTLAAIHQAPEVMLSFDNVNFRPLQSLQTSNRQIRVHNTGKGTARNIGIRAKDLGYEALFEPTPYLEEGKIQEVLLRSVVDDNNLGVDLSQKFIRYLEILYQASDKSDAP